jgi:hypothetical protein
VSETEINIGLKVVNASFEDGTLVLDVPLEYITSSQPNQLPNFKNQKEFVVEEDFTFPQDVSSKLGVEGALVIKSGHYAMTYQNRTWRITLPDLL